MNLPLAGDYINIHTHDGKPEIGIYSIENLMAHEERTPEDIPEQTCSFGIHPWYLNNNNYIRLLNRVIEVTGYPNLAAIGEAGFDKLKGPSSDLQRTAFEEHIAISEAIKKPVIIHCVRAWDELLAVNKKLHPKMPWLIHGFRGSVELAMQLISKGMYLSFWFDFVLRKESSALLKSIPTDRIFLETDGADVDIRGIYKKVADDMSITVEDLKGIIRDNFRKFFDLNSFITTK